MTSPTSRILVVEDDVSGRGLAVFNLEEAGYQVDQAPDGGAGIAAMNKHDYDLVITDVKMPVKSGFDLLAAVPDVADRPQVIVITAFADVALAVRAMKMGAFDFLAKPFGRDQLLITVEKALAQRALTREVGQLRRVVRGTERPMVASSRQMKTVLGMVDKVAAKEATVLITGPSGSGKELVARRLHARSPRADGPFVAVNVAAIPETLLEAELFGVEKGAFTGAQKSRAGRFRSAIGGTIFLDEVGELSAPLQVKLLRVLQERVVDSLGSDKPIPVDVRVVVATNQDLKQALDTGAFRRDLYYRLCVIEVDLPPLKARVDDIEPLVHHFLGLHAPDKRFELDDGARQALLGYSWPGNVRELENVAQRLAIMVDGEVITARDLPFETGPSMPFVGDWPDLPPEGLSLLDLEKGVIARVLDRFDGNVSRAAVYLQIPRHVLAYRMQKYGLAKGS